MLELYEQRTGKKLPYLRDYVENKSEIRQKLANEIGVCSATINLSGQTTTILTG